MKKVLKEEILSLRREGMSFKQIRKVLNCTLSVISYHCKRAGLSGIPNKKPSPQEIEMMNILYHQENLKVWEVAEKTGWCRQTVGLYLKNKRKRVNRGISLSQSVVSWRRRTKQKLVEYKGGKCSECDYDKCIEALQFHHLDPMEKDFTIGGKSWSFEKLKAEADKCILLCANCHIELHSGELAPM